MTDRATLEALLARVLEGTGPDRELDAEIWRIAEPATFTAPHGLDCKPWRYIGNGVWRDDSDLEGHNKAFAPPYTASLDAVLTLVPDGWHAEIGTRPDWPWARLFKWIYPAGNTEFISGPTPPRALMAACIKARMEAQGE